MCELALTKAQSEKRKVKSAKWKAQSEKWKRKAKARFNAPPEELPWISAYTLYF